MEDQYLDMDNRINEFYRTNQEKLASQSNKFNFIKPNGLCMAQSSVNDLFYRGLIVSVEDGIEVNLIDHGIIMKLDSSLVLPILREFMQLPPYCIKCKLQSIKSTQSTGKEY